MAPAAYCLIMLAAISHGVNSVSYASLEQGISRFLDKLWQQVSCAKPKCTITAVSTRGELLEGPFWDQDEQLLYWVDMWKNQLNSYDPATGDQVSVTINADREPVTMVMRVKGTKNRFVVGIKGALAVVRWDGRSTDPLTPKYFADVEEHTKKTRLNDGKADPANRLWVGSMGDLISTGPNVFEKDGGSLYMIGPKGEVEKKVEPLQISNGLEWSLKADKMYLVDSHAYEIYQFDYNNKDGSIGNQKVIFDCKSKKMVEAMNSLPDGMTIDQEGMLWVAVYGTQKVIRIDPNTGKLLLELVIPKALEITSVAFGGKDLDILFVTTAMVDWSDELERLYPDSGRLFKITGLGVKGLPSRDVALDKSIWEDI